MKGGVLRWASGHGCIGFVTNCYGKVNTQGGGLIRQVNTCIGSMAVGAFGIVLFWYLGT